MVTRGDWPSEQRDKVSLLPWAWERVAEIISRKKRENKVMEMDEWGIQTCRLPTFRSGIQSWRAEITMYLIFMRDGLFVLNIYIDMFRKNSQENIY